MLKFIDISFNVHQFQSDPLKIINDHKEGLGYIHFLNKQIDLIVIEHIDLEASILHEEIHFSFFRSKKKFFQLPIKTYHFIKKCNPDIILVQGLGFPFQTIFLRFYIGSKFKILVQHHAECPFKGIKGIIQRLADKCIDAYLFTSLGNANVWIKKGIINYRKCHEVLEASTYFKQINKTECRKHLKIGGEDIFLWVGRLEKNKDPITILLGFEKYIGINNDSKLYMIFQEDELITEVKKIIENSVLLSKAVVMVGKIDHNILPYWFSAADFYVSGSHKEGSGYALIEAMSCGCIPIVTNIPPFRKITAGLGFLFEPGNPISMHNELSKLSNISKKILSDKIVSHFNTSLSFKAIADDIFAICSSLDTK